MKGLLTCVAIAFLFACNSPRRLTPEIPAQGPGAGVANSELIASDDFSSGSLAAGWSQSFVATDLGTVLNLPPHVVEAGMLSVTCGQVWTGSSWTRDQVSEITMNAFTSNANASISLIVRADQTHKNGYEASISNGAAAIYRFDNNVATLLHSVSGLTFAPNDAWSFAAIGAALVLYQNGNYVTSWPDATYTTGVPGFSQLIISGAFSQSEVAAWRGYSAVQQDGVWQKQGVVLQPIASDISTSATAFNSGTNDIYILPNEPGVILSGTVFAGWFWSQTGINYAESHDGKNWTRKATALFSGAYPKVVKVAGTYYLYCQANAEQASAISVYTSTDKQTWTLQNSSVITAGVAGAWDAGLYLFSPVGVISGTWYALYTGVNNNNAYATGLATSSDGIHWFKYAGNPVVQSVFAEVPININGTWYLWGPSVPPGEVAEYPNPTQGQRLYSTDLIHWTKDCVSLRMTGLAEGVNTALGGAYPNCLLQVGKQIYYYYNQTTQDSVSSTGAIWQVSLATAPVSSFASLVQFNEDAVQQIASDGFQRANGSLGANWKTPSGASTLQIASQLAQPVSTGVQASAVYTGARFASSQYSEVTVQTASSGSNACPAVYMRTASDSYYFGAAIGPTGGSPGNHLQIYKRANGTNILLGPTALATIQVGDVIRLSVSIGSDGFPSLTLYQNGWSVLQVEDYSNQFTSGNPGMSLNAGTAVTNAQVSLWNGGNANVIPAY